MDARDIVLVEHHEEVNANYEYVEAQCGHERITCKPRAFSIDPYKSRSERRGSDFA